MVANRRFLPLLLAALAGCAPGKSDVPGETRESDSRAMPMAAKEVRVPIQGRSGSRMTGNATFRKMGDGVHMTLEVRNAPPGLHAVHLHQTADCSSPDAKSAGDHWNPTKEDHGRLGATPSAHRGDIGNLEVGKDGRGKLEFHAREWTIGGDAATNVLNRAVMVHAKADDFRSQPAGNAGDRIGCGEIRG